ncbi:elongation factor 1 gamma, conserved domain-containing protein [Ditylenchus destructor]|uniref:eEF-1B gamma n=1 Tax=Ditylenchus destructor TaxID=166010 RepID=A0AAD4NGF6_9BILA|nr:elongation factor 1 gamma, conserved domain-containing protein [Ditylenchus destructor]
MTKIQVYGHKDNFRTQKVLVAAKLAKKEVSVVEKQPPNNHFPLGVTPALEDGNVRLFGADSIAKHLLGNNTSYNPQNAEVDQWLSWAEGQLLPNVLAYVLPSVSVAHVGPEALAQAKQEVLAQLKQFNALLLHKTFLVGERLTIADVSVALDLLPAYSHVLDDSARSGLVNVNRWFLTVINHAAVKEVVGEFKFISKASTFDENAYKKYAAAATPKKKEEKQEKQEKAPKAAKSKKKDDDDEDDEADEIAAAEPKFVDPFAQMPPGTFVMDAFKRVYSNEDTLTKALPYFWENFDPEHYSIWYSEYKFPKELTLTFMSCNLITGMFQRLEKLKKNAFGSVCLLGTDNDSSISGIWIWRGHKLAFELSPDWQVDYESYDWKKLDPNDDETKKLVKEYFLWEGDFGGKKFNQGKIFK